MITKEANEPYYPYRVSYITRRGEPFTDYCEIRTLKAAREHVEVLDQRVHDPDTIGKCECLEFTAYSKCDHVDENGNSLLYPSGECDCRQYKNLGRCDCGAH